MSEHVAKVIEVIGTSPDTIESAIKAAIDRSGETVRDMRWFQVTELRGHIVQGHIDRYQVMLKIGFALDD